MCGIAGYIGKRQMDERALQSCLKQMGRRGPDAANYAAYKTSNGQHVYLLHSRLNIIDLDARANQPFERQGNGLIYNGELYNYLELKEEFAQQGIRFETESDTEVLLQMLLKQGWKGLDRCEGMWAFALFNTKEESLLLSRDRFGEKPLYCLERSDGFYFGSEIKYIVTLLGQKLPVNYNHVYRYMVNGYKSLYKGREQFFKDVYSVPSGCVVQINKDGAKNVERYWYPRIAVNHKMDYKSAVERTRELLIQSVKLRLRADVPLAFCMSGGVDSNSLISIAKNVLNYDVHGFTITNTDKRYEEQAMVEHAVRELRIRHTAVPVQTDHFLEKLRVLIKQHDAPVYTISYYAHWLLMESIAKGGYRISISGTAADELFSGYFDHHNAYLYEVRQNEELYASSLGHWSEHVKPIVRNPYLSNPNVFVNNPDHRDHIFLDADNFSKFFVKAWSESFYEEQYTEGVLRNRMLNEVFHEAVPPILHEDDLNAMYFSIENRSPFLDRSLFEFCNSIPTEYLIQKGFAKAVLRDAMRGIVPEEIINNHRKVGFNAPIYSFLDIRNPQVRAYLLNDSPIFDHVHKSKVEEIISKPTLTNSVSKFLFYFLNSKMFLEEFAG